MWKLVAPAFYWPSMALSTMLMSHLQPFFLTSNWHSLMGVDADNRPLTPLILWEDTRAHEAAKELGKQFDEAAVHARTGARPHLGYGTDPCAQCPTRAVPIPWRFG